MRGWFGPFRIERQVGRGGLGQVYRAVDTRSGATVALKLMPPKADPLALTRVRREFAALRLLHHPNIVRVLDLGEDDGIPWLAMEFVDGMLLREWLTISSLPQPLEPDYQETSSEGVDLDVLFDEPDSGALLSAARARGLNYSTGIGARLTPEEQAEVSSPERLGALCGSLAQICDGLAFIHARGLVHRDLKPSNILVTADRRAILVDFGLVKLSFDERITDPGRVVGTYRYMAPEQARGEQVDARSDLYSLGATLYELLAGRPPFPQQDQLEMLDAVVSKDPPKVLLINPAAPSALASLAEQLLAKRPEDRPGDAGEVAMMLRAVERNLAARGAA